MDTSSRRVRFIESQKFYFLLWVLFIILFYAVGYIEKPPALPEWPSISEYVRKYGIYLPLVLGALSILKSYILQFIISILHINHWFSKFSIYLIIYGFWLTLGIQLRFFEPRFTDVAIVLIDQYALPLIISSSSVIFFAFLFTIFKRK